MCTPHQQHLPPSEPMLRLSLTAGSFPSQIAKTSVSAGSTSFVDNIGTRSSTITALNASGQAAGYSSIYVGSAANYFNSGQAAWYASPNSNFTAYNTVQIGLYNTGNVIPSNETTLTNVHVSQSTSNSGLGVYNDAPSSPLMNKYGEVAGTSYRFNSVGNTMGTDAWLYGPQQKRRLDLRHRRHR